MLLWQVVFTTRKDSRASGLNIVIILRTRITNPRQQNRRPPPNIFITFTVFTSNFNQKIIKIHNRKILQEFRKSLRNNSTPAEVQLWKLLKNKQVEGLKFRRQHSIENYIVDFYCPEIKLAIEMDGQSHASHAKQSLDHERDARINDLGITVLRFENKIVFEQPEEIVNQIRNYCAK